MLRATTLAIFSTIVAAGPFASPGGAEGDAVRPVIAGNRFVDPYSGEVDLAIPGTTAYEPARPIPGKPPGFFRWGDLVVDAGSREVVGREPFPIAFEDGAVVRRGIDGDVVWTAPLEGHLGGVRPPDRVVDEGRVFVVQEEGLAAFDYESGREIWRAEGPNDRLCAAEGLILATSCSTRVDPVAGRAVVARRAGDGSVAFRVVLPTESDPKAIERRHDLFLVRDEGWGSSRAPYTIFFDAAGAVRWSLEEYVSDFAIVDGDLILASPGRIARLAPEGLASDGRALWEVALAEPRGHDRAALYALDGGGWIAYGWCAIADSGVTVVSVGPDGSERWRASIEPAGVPHSEYWHEPYVEERPGRLVVVSQGAYAHIVETVALDAGTRVGRWVFRSE